MHRPVRPRGDMHVLHVTEYAHVDSTGGIQRYLAGLLPEMASSGVRSALMWLTQTPIPSISAGSMRVVPVASTGPDDASTQFRGAAERALLAAGRPTVVHFHTFGRREQLIAQLCARHEIPYVFTYHYPASLCPNRSLLRWGTTPCDGEVRPLRCTACRVVSIVRAPRAPGAATTQLARGLAVSTRRVPSVVQRQRMAAWRDAVRDFLRHCAFVLFHSPRARPVLEINGARADTLYLCPPGLTAEFLSSADGRATRTTESDSVPFVVGYVGRLDPLKGFGILVEGFMRTDWPHARLRLVGDSSVHQRDIEYAERIKVLARRDGRVQFAGGLPLSANASLYDGMSMLAIPSVGIEGGPPLVLYEAVQLGLPVLASNRIGCPELAARHGRIVEPNTPEQWANELTKVFAEVQLARQWPAEAANRREPPRTMAEVARDIVGHYERILDSR